MSYARKSEEVRPMADIDFEDDEVELEDDDFDDEDDDY